MSNLAEEFERFHRENPRVYELFKRFTFQLIERGFKHHSSDAVVHRIRWHTDVETTTATDSFKIANAHTAFYARLFMADHPQHKGFFRTAVSAADFADLLA